MYTVIIRVVTLSEELEPAEKSPKQIDYFIKKYYDKSLKHPQICRQSEKISYIFLNR